MKKKLSLVQHEQKLKLKRKKSDDDDYYERKKRRKCKRVANFT